MVGSDLESGEGHESGGDGTNDLINMVKGYGSQNPENLNIIVAYGGSTIPGWEGMTIVPITDLITDADDEIIGNEEIGDFFDSSVDMGSADGLSSFLDYVQEKYSGDNTYLIFWNHGGGFEGFGWDEVTDNHLSIPDIASSLEKSDMMFDIIGFDACLMAGIEVAQAMAPYAQYMIASEEISSGGWKYDEWVSKLSNTPDQDPEQFGRYIIESFFDTDEPVGNTASLIDLSRLKPIQDSLDELGSIMQGSFSQDSSVVPIARAFEKTTRFGENFGDEEQRALKIDIGTLGDYLEMTNPEAEEAVANLKTALSNAILYEHHDELMGNATGLSIADPLTISEEDYEEYETILPVSPGWDAFVNQVREDAQTELPSPEIVSVGTNTYSIKDSTGYEEASIVYFSYDNETDTFLQLGSLPLTSDEDSTYSLPEWNGEWYYLTDTENPENYSLIDFYYGDTTGTGITKYLSEVDIIRNGTKSDSLLYSYLDPDSEWTKYSFRPYFTEDENIIFSRSGFTPKPGDGFISYGNGYDSNGTDLGLMVLGDMNLTGSPEITKGILPDGMYGWALQVTSPRGEDTIGDIMLLTIEGGQVSILDVNVTTEETDPKD